MDWPDQPAKQRTELRIGSPDLLVAVRVHGRDYINLFQTSSFFGLPNSYRIVYKNSSGLIKMALLLDLVLPTPALVLALLAVLVHAPAPPSSPCPICQIQSSLKTKLVNDHLAQASFTLALFNLTKHSLSGFPGPRLWACSRIPYVLSLQNGTLPMKIKDLHDIYGPVVRIAPNELSFISPEAWNDIYSDKTSALERGAIFYGGMGQNTILAASHDAHARMRRVLSPAFRSSAVRSYEENMRRYVHLFVERLGWLDKNKACGEKSDTVGRHEAIVDIVRWLNFVTFDMAGNFVYGGDPFGCLRRSEFHPWVGLICSWIKVAVLSFAVRFYSPLDRVLMWLVPPSLRKQKEEFDRLSRELLQKRTLSIHDKADDVGFENEVGYHGALPRDLLSHLTSNKSEGIMTTAEIEANLPLLIIGASETIATTLSGTINYLCQNAAVLKKLTEEVRTAVHHKEDLTMAKLAKLPYLTGVLKEGLRIVSPGPVSLPRIVPAEGISIDGYWVPGHVSLIYLFISLHLFLLHNSGMDNFFFF